MGIIMVKRYTQAEINYLKSLPIVQYVKENRLVLTLKFRQQLYREWEKSPSMRLIRRILKDNGIQTPIIIYDFINNLHKHFKAYGFPTSKSNFSKNDSKRQFCSTVKYQNSNNNEALLATGLFIKKRRGIGFTNEFVEEVRKTYPKVSIEAKLLEKGVDPCLMQMRFL